jgi:uncharacterized membrane protein YdjX (TVP38/TMEM64 family)
MIFKKKYGVIACLIIMASVFFWWADVSKYITLDNLKLYRDDLHYFVEHHYLLSVLVYSGIFVASIVFFIPIGVILTIAGGFLFGTLPGALYAVTNATLGGVITFLLVRYSLGMWVQKKYAKELSKFNQLVRDGGAYYLLYLQLLPATPSFLINTLAGVTKISLWTFIWTAVIGILPATLLYTFTGQELTTIEHVRDIFSYTTLLFVIMSVLVIIVSFIVRRYANIKLT